MKTASANSYDALVFRHYLCSDGVNRKEFKVTCKTCGKEQWVRLGPARALKYTECSTCYRKRPVPTERKQRIGETLRKKYKTDPVWKAKVHAARNVASGPNHWNWKGGVTPLNQRGRTSEDASSWKQAVLHRDNYCCRICKTTFNLEVHHINSWASFPEERFILQNGISLCELHHKLYHQYEKEFNNNGDFHSIKEEQRP